MLSVVMLHSIAEYLPSISESNRRPRILVLFCTPEMLPFLQQSFATSHANFSGPHRLGLKIERRGKSMFQRSIFHCAGSRCGWEGAGVERQGCPKRNRRRRFLVQEPLECRRHHLLVCRRTATGGEDSVEENLAHPSHAVATVTGAVFHTTSRHDGIISLCC